MEINFQETIERERLVSSYVKARNNSNFVEVARVLDIAKNDPELERILTAVDMGYKEQQNQVVDNSIVVIDYNGLQFSGAPDEIARDLREFPYCLTLRDIAKLLNTTATTINTWLKQLGYSGERYGSLSASWLKGKSDEEISYLLSMKVSNVPYHRLKHKVLKLEWVNVWVRKVNLCGFLFGENYKPGSFFNFYLRQLVERNLETERQRGLIINYYLLGEISKPGDRSFRSIFLRRLRDNLDDPDQLVEIKSLERKI